jgi:hypothetical protein
MNRLGSQGSRRRVGLVLVGCVGLFMGRADAVVRRVTPEGTPRVTIQEAIDSASDGDTILVAPGTYAGPGNRDIELRGKALSVIGSGGAARTIIDCKGQPGDPHRGFYIHEGEGRETLIRGFTVTGGYVEGHLPANYGGGILVESTSPTIMDCRLVRNRSNHFGGGMVCYLRASPRLINLEFLDNEATNNGGGLGVKSFCEPEITNVLFARNRTKRGGGFWCLNSKVMLENATFYGNAGLESTGGIWSSQGKMTIMRTIIASSTAGEALSCSLPAEIEVTCSDLFGNAGGDQLGECLSSGGLNFSAEPQFVNPASDDFSLAPGSPCLGGEGSGGKCGQIGYHSNLK